GGRAAGADRLAHASAEVGVVFTGINIATGAIWGKPTWGTWWTWDARLTSVSIMFVIYLGYLLLRAMIEDRERAARFAAVLGIVAALDIPLVHFSVLLCRTLSSLRRFSRLARPRRTRLSVSYYKSTSFPPLSYSPHSIYTW